MNNRRNLGKSTKKRRGKNRKSKSGKQSKSKSEKKNIFKMCDIENFVSVTTYGGGGICDKTFRVNIHCNGDNTQCTYEEESVRNYIYYIY